MGPLEILKALHDYLAMVQGFLTGPFAQREPSKAKSFLRTMSGPFHHYLRNTAEYEERIRLADPAAATKHFLRILDKLVSWALIALPELGPDEAAARKALQPYIDIVQREGDRIGMWLIIEEWTTATASPPSGTSNSKDEPGWK